MTADPVTPVLHGVLVDGEIRQLLSGFVEQVSLAWFIGGSSRAEGAREAIEPFMVAFIGPEAGAVEAWWPVVEDQRWRARTRAGWEWRIFRAMMTHIGKSKGEVLPDDET
jgi:hypothetical protein